LAVGRLSNGLIEPLLICLGQLKISSSKFLTDVNAKYGISSKYKGMKAIKTDVTTP